MPSQQAANYQIALKKQGAKGSYASGGSAVGFNLAAAQGISATMDSIVSPTIRRDGLKTLDGLGMRRGGAVWPMVLGVTKQDILWPMLLRATDWIASFDIDETDFTSITTTTSTIVGASGSFLTLGLRRGMRIKLSGHSTAGNNGKWLSVIGVTASTITLPAGSLTANAVADTAVTITIAKHCYSGAAPVEHYSTLEEFGQDSLTREVLYDAKLTKADLNGGPNAKLLSTFNFMGLDVDFDDTTGTPLFTSPVYPTGRELELSDGVIIMNGVAQNIITDFSFSYDNGGEIEPVLGQVGNDVSLGLGGASGSLSAIREDLTWLKRFKAKTPFEAFLIAQEPESDPQDFLSFYMGNCLTGSPTKNIAQTGTTKDGAPFTAGVDDGGGDRVQTVMLISSSAA